MWLQPICVENSFFSSYFRFHVTKLFLLFGKCNWIDEKWGDALEMFIEFSQNRLKIMSNHRHFAAFLTGNDHKSGKFDVVWWTCDAPWSRRHHYKRNCPKCQNESHPNGYIEMWNHVINTTHFFPYVFFFFLEIVSNNIKIKIQIWRALWYKFHAASTK